MAHLHFKRTVYKSGGAAASGRVAYITRQPVHALSAADQQLRYIQDGREDLVYTRSRNLPAWSAGQAHVYFHAAECQEGKNRVAFEEWKISLPQELSHRENMALTRDLVDAIAGDSLPVVYAFHDPTTLDDTRQQPHLHMLISSRRTDEHMRTPEQHFRKYNRAHPERGGAEKDPAFWHMGSVKAHRVMVSDILNAHVERAGHTAMVHPDSLLDRGMDRQPEPKLLPSESRQYREHGIITATMQQVLDVRAERTQSVEMEQADSQRYWTQRKTQLGITPEMSHAHALECITAAREQQVTHAPERPTLGQIRDQTQTLERSVNGLERYVQTVQRTLRQEQRLEQTRGPYEWRQMRDAERVLAEGVKHGLPRDHEAEGLVRQLTRYLDSQEQEPQAGAALDVRIFREREEERERERGMDLGF